MPLRAGMRRMYLALQVTKKFLKFWIEKELAKRNILGKSERPQCEA